MAGRKFFLGVLLLMATAAGAQPAATPKVAVTETADMVVVYVHDLDQLRRNHPALAAEIRLGEGDRTWKVDLAADYQTPAILIRKAAPKPVGHVFVTLRDGPLQLLRTDLPIGPLIEAKPRIALSDAKAFIEPGDAPGESFAPPPIAQPDLAKIRTLPLPDAQRVVELTAATVPVVSDISYPLVSAANNCAVSRQTAHPDDPELRSAYVPLKSQIYDPQTGEPSKVIHYLAEIPIDPAWKDITQDTAITLAPGDIRVHLPPADNLITGTGPGGLGQNVGTADVDDEGNLYYSESMPAHVVRFNIAKARFEVPPIDLLEAINKFLPKEGLPPEVKGKQIVFDGYIQVNVGGGRMFLTPVRNNTNANTVYLNGVFGFPLEHWDDAEKFAAGARMLAGSWPGAGGSLSLYDDWPAINTPARKLAPGFYHESAYYLTHYANTVGGPWKIDLNPDGSASAIQRVADYEIDRASRDAAPRPRESAGGMFDWTDYGVLTTTRGAFTRAWTRQPLDLTATQQLTIQYDALAAMRADPQRSAMILSSQKGPALAPCYMNVEIPGKPGHFIGAAEYGYYLADYDLTAIAQGAITKRFLKLDRGQPDQVLPVKIGLGPYGRLWRRDGDKLYLIMVGYRGFVSMLYSEAGKVLPRHHILRHTLSQRSLDGAQPGGTLHDLYPLPGIDNWIFFTGVGAADRGGTPYSSGLQAVRFPKGAELLRLTRMSRACGTNFMRSRVIYEPDGLKRQQLLLAGGMSNPTFITMLKDRNVPGNKDAKLFIYECIEGKEPRGVLGISQPVVDGKSNITDQVFSRDRRYLITWQHNCLLTFDLATWRYIDGCRLDTDIWEFPRPDYRLNVGPDDRIYFCAQTKNAAQATFYELEVSPEGAISLRPHLTLKAATPDDFKPLQGAVISFISRPETNGSYDLTMAPWWRMPGTRMWVFRDFIPKRVP